MPHDRNSRKVEPGQIVRVDFKVKQVHLTEEYCNLDLETVWPMHPGDSRTALTLNAKQVEVKEGFGVNRKENADDNASEV